MKVDFESKQSFVMVNPRLPSFPIPSDWIHYSDFREHFWLATSGTTSSPSSEIKWVALSKRAIFTSAAAVNHHLGCQTQDRWINCLPLFHIGGLAIYARAHCLNTEVIEFPSPKWDAHKFYDFLYTQQAAFTSLVPTQLFDLVQAKLIPPSSLKAVIIGGGYLSEHLYRAATHLQWPLLPSYGMSECASQIATATLHESSLKILPHVSCRLTEEGFLQIKSEALLTGYLYASHHGFRWEEPKQEGWLSTEDHVELNDQTLRFLGRAHDWIKISGENVSLPHLEQLFDALSSHLTEAALVAIPDARLGYRIAAVTTQQYAKVIEAVRIMFNGSVMPYERIQDLHVIDIIPRNPMGKIQKHLLVEKVLQLQPIYF